ncbi:DUF1801 domain-containing protein [Pararhodobacter zhoushanensis]|uniref:DUF1801 domain-containing protein n=1 Tax=Pararhodobacter zhoushanensis TaxID=2479545 RepID=UPI000F8F69BD|nr:DUF1801 domain-containing protein [Pararhodobacter zhoushanensis]
MSIPAPPDAVAAAFERLSDALHARLQSVRALIFAVADEAAVGPLTETLKWGEPAYLPPGRAGTTIRLGVSKTAPDQVALFVHCQTTLIDGFRDHFGDTFAYEGKRALILHPGPIPEAALAQCIRAALTYHRRG